MCDRFVAKKCGSNLRSPFSATIFSSSNFVYTTFLARLLLSFYLFSTARLSWHDLFWQDNEFFSSPLSNRSFILTSIQYDGPLEMSIQFVAAFSYFIKGIKNLFLVHC